MLTKRSTSLVFKICYALHWTPDVCTSWDIHYLVYLIVKYYRGKVAALLDIVFILQEFVPYIRRFAATTLLKCLYKSNNPCYTFVLSLSKAPFFQINHSYKVDERTVGCTYLKRCYITLFNMNIWSTHLRPAFNPTWLGRILLSCAAIISRKEAKIFLETCVDWFLDNCHILYPVILLGSRISVIQSFGFTIFCFCTRWTTFEEILFFGSFIGSPDIHAVVTYLGQWDSCFQYQTSAFSTTVS